MQTSVPLSTVPTALWFGAVYGSESPNPLKGEIKETDLSLLGTDAPSNPYVESELQLAMSYIMNHIGHRFVHDDKLENLYSRVLLDEVLASDSLSQSTIAPLRESREAIRCGHLPGSLALTPKVAPRAIEGSAPEKRNGEDSLLRR